MLRVSGQIPKLARRPEVLVTSRLATDATKPSPHKPPTQKVLTIKPAAPYVPRPDEARGGGSFFGKLLAGFLLGSGGLVAYAWYDPDFRKQLEGNLPTAVQNIINQYVPASQEPVKQKAIEADIPSALKKAEAVKDIPPAIKKAETPKETPVEDKSKSPERETLDPKKLRDDELKAKEEAKKKQKREALEQKEEEKKELQDAKRREEERLRKEKQNKEAKVTEENKALEKRLKVLSEEAKDEASAAIESQKIAASLTKIHTQKLKAAMDLSEDVQGKEREWEEVTIALESRQDAKDGADKHHNSAKRLLNKLEEELNKGKETASTQKNKALRTAEEALNNFKYELNTAVAEVTKAESEARVMQEYKELVKKGREQFRKELESILPEVTKASGAEKLTEEELNSLIAHAHRRIEQLQRQLLEATVLEQTRIQAALDRQREEDARIADQRVEREKERLQAQFRVAKMSWDAEAEVQFEERLRQHLSRQAAAHSDHLSEVLKVQEKELEDAFQMYLADKIEEEQDKFREKTAQWVGRMGGIELALTARSDKEQRARKAQELWLACTALNNIIANGKPEAYSYEDQLKPLGEEIEAIKAAGNKHPFVDTITDAVPEQALNRGVWTEEALKDRFRKVHRISRRVAMINETGGSLFEFLLSYVQSGFVRDSTVTESEVDVEALNTFAIVDTARYYMEKGNLEFAVRLMNQLRGESRAAAVCWIEDARLFLETRQAASVLLAHASAEGLGALV